MACAVVYEAYDSSNTSTLYQTIEQTLVFLLNLFPMTDLKLDLFESFMAKLTCRSMPPLLTPHSFSTVASERVIA